MGNRANVLLMQGKALSDFFFFHSNKPNQSPENRDISDLWVSQNTSSA